MSQINSSGDEQSDTKRFVFCFVPDEKLPLLVEFEQEPVTLEDLKSKVKGGKSYNYFLKTVFRGTAAETEIKGEYIFRFDKDSAVECRLKKIEQEPNHSPPISLVRSEEAITTTYQVAESAFRRLLDEFKNVKVTEIDGYKYILFGNSIQCEHAILLTNTGQDIKGLLLREAYFKVQDQILKESERIEKLSREKGSSKNINIHLGGTPGIGKSVFGLFFIYQFAGNMILEHYNTIIYDNNNNNKAAFIYNRSSNKLVVCHRDQMPLMQVTWKNAIYILDHSVPTAPLPAHLNIFISSPNEYKATDFHKLADLDVYMPVWSLDELISCHGALGSTSSLLDVQQVFKLIGGIPRYVIQKLEYSDVAKIRQEVIQLILAHPANTLVKFFETKTANVEVAYQLLHICPTNDLTGYSVEFGSELIRNAIMYKFVHESKYEAWQFLQSDTSASSFGGTVFKEWAHNGLASGGKFIVKHLDRSNDAAKNQTIQIGQELAETELVLDKKKILFYDFSSDWEEQLLDQIKENSFCGSPEMFIQMLLKLSPEQRQSFYFKPLKLNHGTLDSFMLPDIMLQFTVSSDYSLKLSDEFKTVLQIMRRVSNNDKLIPKLYWVLPEKVYDSFNHKILPTYNPQQTKKSNNEVEEDSLSPFMSILGSCPQYKLMLQIGCPPFLHCSVSSQF